MNKDDWTEQQENEFQEWLAENKEEVRRWKCMN